MSALALPASLTAPGWTGRVGQLLGTGNRWLARRVARRPLAWGAGPGVISLSFDDAPASACREGRDILAHHGAQGTWYIAGGLTDQDEQGHRCHSVRDLQQLAAQGHELGCHTFSHQPVTGLGLPRLREELARNARFFTDTVGVAAPRHFSFPLGDYGLLSKPLVGAGFESVRLTRPGIHRGQADLSGLLAQPLYDSGLSAAALQAQIEATAACGGWLILYTHAVADQPGPWGCTPAQLAQALRLAQQAGCLLLPVGQAIAHLRSRGATPH
ncbi:polysaccharide deacetylase family protein [Curvibacter sp. HBC28]|uniref:Polysaccharide deacetylase family protein n=1 Tax=Curvibacter microcysteis TaxID=3026419 RepID=A0ABT5MFP3_9BURK|nr:polysaccharide deacetylase family protein [Curvibacter sp. HBC28]MDD0814834.1 polysaccharide deacetylase family protein [Curvibacter sp. HBC28]